MKAFVTLATAAVAAAAPEADPQVLLNHQPLVYTNPAVLTHPVVPAVQAVPAVQTVYKAPEVEVKVEKAEESPVVYKSPLVQAITKPVVYKAPVAVQQPIVYTTNTQYVAPTTQYVAQPAVTYAAQPAVTYAAQPVAYANKVYHAENGAVKHTVINKREANPVDYVQYPTGHLSSVKVPTLEKTLKAYGKYPVVQTPVVHAPVTSYAAHVPTTVYNTAYNTAYQTPVAPYTTPYLYHY